MKELLENRFPRSPELIDNALRPMSTRLKRAARKVSVAIGLIVAAATAIGLASMSSDDAADGAGQAVLFAFFVGLMFVLILRWYLLRDVRIARRLLRSGTARIATEMAQSAINAMPLIDAIWEDGHVTYFARIDAFQYDHEVINADQLIVISSPRSTYAAVVLGENGLFVAPRRTLRDHR